MMRILFVCSRNRLRSPTAEALYRDWPELEVASAGLAPDADNLITPEDVQWADWIVVMEQTHRRKLMQKFAGLVKNKRVICLGIPDEYRLMDPALIESLQQKFTPLLYAQGVSHP